MGIKDIKYDQHNYREHDERNLSLIKKSIQRCGAGRSILLDKNGEIIAGNATYKTLQELGIPVKIIPTDGKTAIALQRTDLDTNDRKRKELAAFDNSTSDNVKWDFDHIAADFDLSELPDFGIEALPDMAPVEPVEEDDAPDVSEVPPRVKKGDIWQLGEHRLMCGDSTVIADVEKLMAGEKADMVFTDPPYGVKYEGGLNEKKKKQIKNDNISGDNLYNFLLYAFTNAKQSSKEKSPFYVFYSIRSSREFINAFFDAGLKQRSIIAWYKKGGGFGDYMAHYMNAYEPCIYGSNGESVNWYGPTNEKTIWEIEKEKICNLHPTMKPISVVARAVKNSSKKENIVLDLFGGSGSTMIACEQLGRKAYLMELDPHYCDVIIARWETLTGKQAQLL